MFRSLAFVLVLLASPACADDRSPDSGSPAEAVAVAAPAPPSAPEADDPPTMKNAGRLNYEGEMFGVVFGTLLFGLLAVGALLQAVMTNHGRGVQGFALNALAAAAALAMFTGMIFAAGAPIDWEYLAITVLPMAVIWAVLAALALAVGTIVQPPGRPKRRA